MTIMGTGHHEEELGNELYYKKMTLESCGTLKWNKRRNGSYASTHKPYDTQLFFHMYVVNHVTHTCYNFPVMFMERIVRMIKTTPSKKRFLLDNPIPPPPLVALHENRRIAVSFDLRSATCSWTAAAPSCPPARPPRTSATATFSASWSPPMTPRGPICAAGTWTCSATTTSGKWPSPSQRTWPRARRRRGSEPRPRSSSWWTQLGTVTLSAWQWLWVTYFPEPSHFKFRLSWGGGNQSQFTNRKKTQHSSCSGWTATTLSREKYSGTWDQKYAQAEHFFIHEFKQFVEGLGWNCASTSARCPRIRGNPTTWCSFPGSVAGGSFSRLILSAVRTAAAPSTGAESCC